MNSFFAAVALLVFVAVQSSWDQGCSFPPPASNFKNQKYEGEWFEIGKIQTKGGAFFERDCVCTELNVSPKNESIGEYYADNDCRITTTNGV